MSYRDIVPLHLWCWCAHPGAGWEVLEQTFLLVVFFVCISVKLQVVFMAKVNFGDFSLFIFNKSTKQKYGFLEMHHRVKKNYAANSCFIVEKVITGRISAWLTSGVNLILDGRPPQPTELSKHKNDCNSSNSVELIFAVVVAEHHQQHIL